MAKNKTQPTKNDVLDFINSVTDDKRRTDAKIALDLFDQVLDEQPTMWGSSIIGYGMYRYRYDSGREGDFLVVGFSPRKANLTFYIMPGFDANADAAQYDPKPILDRLGPYKTGKSCLYIKDVTAVDNQAIKDLILLSVQQMQELATQPDSYVTDISINLK